MKRKKTIKFHIGGVMGDDFTVTVEAKYGPSNPREYSKEHIEALASRIVLALTQHTLLPVTCFKVR